jgi:RNase P subunit RPR2
MRDDMNKSKEKQDNRLNNKYRETNCPHCNKLIRYHINDVLSKDLSKENILITKCPFCKERIKIKITYIYHIEAIK